MPAKRKFKERKGFALILVFSLASIILLLGLSLVSLTQVETASSRYDQGLRVARANARLALEMAIGDLQELAGPDQRITATADGRRAGGTIGDSFNDVTDPATTGVYQPFWTGVWNNNNSNDNAVWLVTRPLDATYTLDSGVQVADPFVSNLGSTNDIVKLVGAGSAKPQPGDNQSYYDVYVPKDLVASDNIVGLATSDEATVGHYAYWVGDNGVKTSYLLQDSVPEVLHEPYGSNPLEQRRLRQMMVHRNHLEVDGTFVDVDDATISSIISEFALREEKDGDISNLGMGLGSYTQNDVYRRFHDFSGISKGLLVDTVNGGLKEDLSNIHSVNTGDTDLDALVNSHLMPYLNVDAFAPALPTDLTRSYVIGPKVIETGSGDARPTIAPLITEFQLLVKISVPELGIGAAEPERRKSIVNGQFGVSVELWNPYTSRLQGADLRISIENPSSSGLEVHYYDNYVLDDPPTVTNAVAGFGLEDVMNNVSEFHLDASGSWWESGEVKVFSGAYDPVNGILNLNSSASIPVGSSYDYLIDELPEFESSDEIYGSDRLSLDGPVWSPELTLRTSSGDVLSSFSLSGISFNEMKSSPTVANAVAQPHLSYKFKLRDPDVNWMNYDPRVGLITSGVVMDSFDDPNPPPLNYIAASMAFFEYPGSNFSFNSTVDSSIYDLLGFTSDGTVKNNIPLFELPRQELLSLGSLQFAEFPSGVRNHLGMSTLPPNPSDSINDVFDRFFLSTVPQLSATSWSVGNPLPNPRMEVTTGSSKAELQEIDSAKHLFLNGAFNLNSTSVEAWASLLQGIRLGTWVYDDPAGSSPLAGQDELTLTDEAQLFRFSQSAEETWRGDYTGSATFDAILDPIREDFRKGLRSFSKADVESLAIEIVRNIRSRRQAAAGSVGPLVSLQDFVDAGIIESAILNAGINVGFTEGSSNYLTQQDVLTAIAPFLSARSDTFLIRAYGDSVNPFDSTQVLARAYCEAIVQRVHEKHPTESNADPMVETDNSAGSYGRIFKVIAFRWMTGDEI